MMGASLDRAMIERAFTAMGELAARDGKLVDIAIYGGSCLVLSSDIRDATRDVDAVFLSQPALAYRLADRVGRQLGLPEDWLSQAVRQYVGPSGGNPEPSLFPIGEYPKVGTVGLRAYVPTPEYMLAMKLIANRTDEADADRDFNDILALVEVCGLETKRDLTDLVTTCYPMLTGISARLDARLDDILEERKARHDGSRRGQPPSWHALRGRPTRP